MADVAPEILLFARGAIALLDLWPALTIAVREGWGGPESADKKTFLASELIDQFESNVDYKTAPDGSRSVDPSNATDPPLDIDQISDLLSQIMSDEFDAAVEDDSIEPLAGDILRLWRDIVAPSVRPAEVTVSALEAKAIEISKRGVNAQSGGGAADVDENGEEWESDSEDDDDEVPQLVAADTPKREHQAPVVDDDGFTLVQKKGGRR